MGSSTSILQGDSPSCLGPHLACSKEKAVSAGVQTQMPKASAVGSGCPVWAPWPCSCQQDYEMLCRHAQAKPSHLPSWAAFT